jgi:eukaryotic-like serine/threonine-protein kinase
MHRLIKELRRREVFRTVGLYVGIGWITIEGASVMLPAFDAPEWVLRAVIILAIVGLPVAIILAWIYDATDSGIEVTADPTDTVIIPFGGRKTDFVVIGVLTMALGFSFYLNLTSTGSGVAETIEPISVLIADFNNQTGDPLFDGSLEQALNIGLEGATFITAYKRTSALRLLETIYPGSRLDEDGARLVSLREGIKLVVSGSVVPDDDGYDLSARMVNPEDGVVLAESSVEAKSKLEVLTAISALADDIREELGDESVNDADRPLGETFTSTSLESVKNYTQAQNLAAEGRYDESLPFYQQAIAFDANFGRAYSGWALSLFYLGREDQATALWERALTEMDSMTERERFRTLGLYYVAVAGDYPKAVESYQALVDKYPADNTGHNNMAISYYFMLDFKKAMEAAGRGLEIYPTNKTVISNYALFAMLAGEFDNGAQHAEELLAVDPGMWKAWLPIAMQKLASGDIAGAEQAYESMAKASDRGVPFSNLGLADVALFEGDYAKAAALLEAGVSGDLVDGNKRLLGRKYIALAEARAGLGDAAGAREALQQALDTQQGNGQLVPAALISLEIGDVAVAAEIAEVLGQELQPNSRSYGRVIDGAIATQEGRHADAVDALRSAITLTDSWLVRFYLGRAYFEAGRYVEALDEFEICLQRRGEATALFQDDDEPTWHAMAWLNTWMGKARDEMGITAAAEPGGT